MILSVLMSAAREEDGILQAFGERSVRLLPPPGMP
jgi:hypothetical protein